MLCSQTSGVAAIRLFRGHGQRGREARQGQHNMVKATGAKRVAPLEHCAEGYRTWKVDYPKCLISPTNDLGFKVVHLIEFADDLMKAGKLKLKKAQDIRMTYHDSCGVSRLCDPWTPWKGERGWMGMVEPRLKRRRGTTGLYAQPRNLLSAIPGAQLVGAGDSGLTGVTVTLSIPDGECIGKKTLNPRIGIEGGDLGAGVNRACRTMGRSSRRVCSLPDSRLQPMWSLLLADRSSLRPSSFPGF